MSYFNQKEWLERELDETGPEKKKAKSKRLHVEQQNYWITCAETSIAKRSKLTPKCGAVGQTSWNDFFLLEAWFTAKCLENMKWFTLEHFNTIATDELF